MKAILSNLILSAFKGLLYRRVEILSGQRKSLITALKRAGFLVQRVKGSHHFLRHPDGRTTVVPMDSGASIGPSLLVKVLRDVDLTRNELEELLA